MPGIKAWGRPVLLVVLYVWVSLVVTMVFFVYPGVDHYSRARFKDMIDGKASKPFVLRTLVPTTVRLVVGAVPQSAAPRLRAALFPNTFTRAMGWTGDAVLEYYATFAICAISFLSAAVALRWLLMATYRTSLLVEDLAPVGAMGLVPGFFRANNYIYDPMTLATWAWATVAIVARNRTAYYIFFCLALLNKETALLLIAVFAVREYRLLPRRTLAAHVAAQVVLWGLVRGAVLYIYRDNPGLPLEFHLVDHNLPLLGRPVRLVAFLAVIGFWTWMIGSGWSGKPAFVRRGFLIAFIPMAVMVLLFGFMDEYRDFYEVYPLMFLLMLPTVLGLEGGDVAVRNRTEFPMVEGVP